MSAAAPDRDLERLRRANPVPAGAVRGMSLPPRAEALLEAILAVEPELAAPRAHLAAPAAPARLRRRLRPAVVVPVAAVLAAAAAAAGYGLAAIHPSQPYEVACYASDDLAGRSAVPAGGASPVAGCAALWAAGELGDSSSAPPLTTCVLGSGAYAVLPGSGDGPCTRAGLPEALPPAPSGNALVTLQRLIIRQLNLAACATTGQAGEIVTRELHALGLSSWSVALPGPGAAPGCATAAIVPSRQVVQIVPLPPTPAPPAGASSPT